MNRKEAELISNLQNSTNNIRNFCILAHVDHGKTTLADALLATNGIISNRMSGKLRYMDSRKDEQERGITMKSSAISLVHIKNDENYVINLIDSPGHVDFSTEVSTAVRLCDAALILIDVCEGICPQTHAVLRQASLENLKLILILNKIDRLILELKMTPLEAYYHMSDIIVQFNAIVAQQYTSLILEKTNELSENDTDESVDWIVDIDESKLYFSPKYNNVFFSSSIDVWGFGINNFADIYAKKLGFKKDTLLKTLWGDYYLNAKTKRILKDAQENGKKPLFVQLVLESIWQVYDAIYTRRDTAMTEKILTSLNIRLTVRDLKYTDPKGPLHALFYNWLPLGKNLLDLIIDVFPSPKSISTEKVEHLISNKVKPFKMLPKETQKLKDDFLECSSGDSKPVIVFISKMFAVEKDCISKKQLTLEDIALKRDAIRQRKLLEEERLKHEKPGYSKSDDCDNLLKATSDECPAAFADESEENLKFLAFARVFSGTLRKGQDLFILSPKHNCEDFIGKNLDLNSPINYIQAISKYVTKFTVNELYLMMGRDLELIDKVPSGNIVAIGGLENFILKSATLSSTLFCPSFSSMFMQTAPIVRVAIEPKNPSKINQLLKGLKLLNQADPCVEIFVQENGEHILGTAGEVHLQRCIDDLVNCFAKIEVNVSPPIIPFKETIIEPPKFDYLKEKIKVEEKLSTNQQTTSLSDSPLNQTHTLKDFFIKSNQDGRIIIQSLDKRLSICVIAKPLPIGITQLLEKNISTLKSLSKLNKTIIADIKNESYINMITKLKSDLKSEFERYDKQNNTNTLDYLDRIISFGPNKCGANILINRVDSIENINSVWCVLESRKVSSSSPVKEFENNITFSFQLVTSKGPLCEEPMHGVAFLLEKFQVNEPANAINVEEQLKNLNLSETNQPGIINENSLFSLEKADEKRTQKVQSLSSLCISISKEAFKRSFEAQPQRLMAAMYKCQIMTVNSEALGKLYAVLGKRDAKILDETVKEGTCMFIITAQLPVAESFGLTEEIRKRTSGLASPHIEFSHFETIEIDPFWEPKTEEEKLLFGDKADFENPAKKYMNNIRKRKGLFVKEKLIEHSEKQRTLIRD